MMLCMLGRALLYIHALVDRPETNRVVFVEGLGDTQICYAVLMYSKVDVLSNGIPTCGWNGNAKSKKHMT